MDRSHVGNRPPNGIVTALRAAAFFFLLAVPPAAVDAAGFTVAEGIVERVAGQVVTVRSQNHDIGRARILDPSGKTLSVSELTPGKKVALHVERGMVTTVVIYPSMVE